MFSTCFIDSRGQIFACGCEFWIKSRATATFCKSDSGVRARNVALVSMQVTFPEIVVFVENRRKSKTCISHALEAYFRTFQKGWNQNVMVWQLSQAHSQKSSSPQLPQNENESGVISGVHKCASGGCYKHIRIFVHFHEIRICYVFHCRRRTLLFWYQKSIAFILPAFQNRTATAGFCCDCL